MPTEQELMAENKGLREQMLKRELEITSQQRARDEAHATEVRDSAAAREKREGQIRTLVGNTLRAEASRAGARDESLDELQLLLGKRIGFSDDMEPFVMNDDGTPKMVHGRPQPIAGFVKEYLDGHTHHRKAGGAAGGGARGGAALHGQAHAPTSVEAARARYQSGDRSVDAINELFKATRAS